MMDISGDVTEVRGIMLVTSNPLTNGQVLYYLLRVLHVMTESLERIADAYCARHPNVTRWNPHEKVGD